MHYIQKPVGSLRLNGEVSGGGEVNGEVKSASLIVTVRRDVRAVPPAQPSGCLAARPQPGRACIMGGRNTWGVAFAAASVVLNPQRAAGQLSSLVIYLAG